MSHEDMNDDNPYSAPLPNQSQYRGPIPSGSGSYIGQLKPLCICMIIQGFLEIFMGVVYVSMGFILPNLIMNQQGRGGPPPMPVDQQQVVQSALWVVYSVGGGIALIAGILRIAGGIRGLSFRNWGLGVTANFLAMLNLITCYCVPTSLALCIWGTMVYFNPAVKEAFRLANEGHSASDIEKGFASGEHMY